MFLGARLHKAQTGIDGILTGAIDDDVRRAGATKGR
jgi:hypothetical protein